MSSRAGGQHRRKKTKSRGQVGRQVGGQVGCTDEVENKEGVPVSTGLGSPSEFGTSLDILLRQQVPKLESE